MRKRRRRRRMLIILAIIGVIAVIVCVQFARQRGKMTGTEWFLEQQKYVEELAQLANDTDNITAMYLAGQIDESDFLTHVSVLNSELTIMRAVYERDASEVRIKNGTTTTITKKGCESVPACYEVFANLYEAMAANSSEPDQLTYAYLAYQQEMISALANYETSMTLLYGESLGYDYGEIE